MSFLPFAFRVSYLRAMCAPIIVLFGLCFSPAHAASPRRIVVLTDEDVSVGFKQAVSDFLKEKGFRLLSHEELFGAQNKASEVQDDSYERRIEQLVQDAEEGFLDFDFNRAERSYVHARRLYVDNVKHMDSIEALVNIHIKLGEVYEQEGRLELRDLEFSKALVLRPSWQLKKAEFSPQFIVEFEQIKHGLASQGYAVLNINSVPQAAEVTLNGQALCETPCVLNSVLPGAHYVKIQISGFRAFWKKLHVQGGTMLPLQVSLQEDLALQKQSALFRKVRFESKDTIEEELKHLSKEHHINFVVRLHKNYTEIFQQDIQDWQNDIKGSLAEQFDVLAKRLDYLKVPTQVIKVSKPWYGHWAIPLGIGVAVLGAAAGTYFLMQESNDVIHGKIYP